MYPNFVLETATEVDSNVIKKISCIFHLAWLNCKLVACMNVGAMSQTLRRYYK